MNRKLKNTVTYIAESALKFLYFACKQHYKDIKVQHVAATQ